MSIDELMGDEIYIESPSGEIVGPVKASVQRNKIYINDEKLIIEEGGKILRPLPNGKAESHLILQVDFHKDPIGGDLSHYEITTRKETSLVPSPSSTIINISHSQGIQIGDGNIQSIVASFETLLGAIDSMEVPEDQKKDVKAKLKAFLSHPLTTTVLGSAVSKILEMIK
ncbi:MAG: hypothetical protein DRH24_14325 [Deltaproteobacteria bacterium]|nr:MAG: hypothetical protein DRH24_14325 [Deltaproteobacteria bacterium]